jgi:integrase
LGYLDGQVTLSGTTKMVFGNPMRGVCIPSAADGDETYAYSLEEITRMLLYLPQPAYTVAAVAAFSGLRRSELAGLLWENYNGSEIWVTRSVWEGHVNEPKTRKSKAPVPVITPLAKILDAYRQQCSNPLSGDRGREHHST